MDRWFVRLVALSVVGCGASHGNGGDGGVHQGSDAAAADGPITRDGPQPSSCTATPATTAPLDPSCVYLLGTLTPGTVGRTIVIQTAFPDDYRVGFGELAYDAHVRHDGRLLFIDEPTPNVDAHAYLQVPDVPAQPGDYPPAPLANDDVLSTPACIDPDTTVNQLFQLPGTDAYAYQCGHDYGTFHRSDTQTSIAVGNDQVHGFSAGGVALVSHFGGDGVRLLDGATSIPVIGVANVVAIRWTGDGFLAASFTNKEPGSFAATLDKLSLSGQVTVVGDYQFDAATQSLDQFETCTLESGGALWCIFIKPSGDVGTDNTVVRLTTDAPPTIEYDEAVHAVKIHGGQLITND